MDYLYQYYLDDDDYSSDSSNDEQEHMTGGVRPTKYLQPGHNNVNTPLHQKQTMEIASAGKFNMGKMVKSVGKKVGKEVYDQAKPIVVAEGKKQLKKVIETMLSSEPQKGGRRKKDLVRSAIDDIEDLGSVMQRQDGGGKKGLRRKLGALPDQPISGGKKKNPVAKFFKTIGKSPVTKAIADELLHQGIETGLKMAMSGAGGPHSNAMKPGPRKGGSSARGAIVKKVMQEQGLGLGQASKYVKEHGLY